MTDRENAPPLHAFGLLVRATRVRKGLTQDRAARGAGVSRKQWALLEQGQNVSAAFLQKVAAYLELSEIPLGGNLHARTEPPGLDLAALLALADDLTTIGEKIRAIALNAALPSSERSTDAAAIADFVVSSGRGPAADARNLNRALQQLAADVVRPVSTETAPRKRNARRAKRRER